MLRVKIFCRLFSSSSRLYLTVVDHNKDYFKILGVDRNCSNDKIKQSYYRLSKVYHPDINQTDLAVKKFHEISEAYEILTTPSLRLQYDSLCTRTPVYNETVVHPGFRHRQGNYNARGPPQTGRTNEYDYDEWFRRHYSESFKTDKQNEQRADWSANEDYRHKDYSRHNFRDLALLAFTVFVLFTFFSKVQE